MKKKIAVIGLKGLPAFGGAATVGENIIYQLKDQYDFIVYSTSSHTNYKTGTYNEIKQVVFKKLPLKRLNSLYYYVISTIHALYFGNYNLIHLHHRDAAFIILLLRLKYKVILTTHNSFFIRDKWKKYEWYFKLNEKYFVKKANIITCVSKYESYKYKNLYNINAIFIPNGINIIENNFYQSRNNDINYLFFGAGRIIRTKGLEILLNAIKNAEIKYKLLVAGDLNQTQGYKKEILELSKDCNIEFLGLIKNKKKLFEYISNSTLFIFPSTYEAMSMMLLEAASLKAPVICSDIIANKAVFNDEHVLYFHSNDSKDLADKIHWALENMSEMKIKAERAYQKLKLEYQWKDIAKKYGELYSKLIQ